MDIIKNRQVISLGLRFVYGRAGSGKSSFCLSDIKASIASGNTERQRILLVPEQFSFQSEKNLINTLGEEGILKAQVLSFKRMAYKVFSEAGGIVREHINAAGKTMLLYSIIDEVKNDLKAFARAGRQQGFVDIMSSTITEFKRYNITPELLKLTADTINGNEMLKQKLQDINLIFEKFEEKLRDSYVDSEDDLTILAQKLHGYSGFNGAEIWIDEFESFTPQQYTILEKLMKKAARVTIAMTTDSLNGNSQLDNTDVFHPVKSTERKLLKIIQENNIPYEKPINLKEQYRFQESAALRHLEKYFYNFPYKKYNDSTDHIKLFKAVNIYSEVENTAKDIVRLVRDNNMRYRDIAVVTRNLKAYENLAEAIFNQYGIPYFMDTKRDIESNPIIMMLNSVIEIYTKNWTYDSVFKYLKTGITGIQREDIDVLENYVLANGIRGKKWTEEDNWNYRLNYGFEDAEISIFEMETLQKINATKILVTEPLVRLFGSFREAVNAREICSAIYNFSVEILIPERIEGWIEEFKVKGHFDKANEYAQIWNIFIGLLDQIVDVAGSEKVKLDKFAKLLTAGINQYKTAVIPSALDQVLIGSIERVKSHDISVLYIIGVNDGVFPAASNEEGILSDNDREILRQYGMEIAEDTRSQAFVEQFLVYTTLSIASQYLRISYPIADAEGKTLRPSIIISRLKKIFPEIKEESDVIKIGSEEENLNLVSTADATFGEFVAVMRSQREGITADKLWWDVYRWYMKKEDWRERCRRAFEGFEHSNRLQNVKPQKIRQLYGEKLYFSVSRLEKYVECPFAYYVQYGLKAKDRKVYEFSAPDLGTFMHNVLDDFSRELEVNNMDFKDLERLWSDNTISDIVDRKVAEKNGFILNSSSRYRYITDRLKNILKTSVWFMAEQIKRGSFSPRGHEVSFGTDGDYPPITVRLPSGDKINLIGRIDRIDELVTEEGTYYRIIDYKSGAKSFKLSDVYYGLQLQLMVYLDAILSNAEKFLEKGIFPGAIFYFRIDDPMISSKGDIVKEKLEEEIMKKFKLNGLLLKDAKLVREMDNGINAYSLIIPAYMKKDGTIGESSAATLEQFELLRSYVRKLVINICEEMLNGNISVTPCRKKDFTPCSYCRYLAVCGFDPGIEGNSFRNLTDKKDEEIFALMKGNSDL